MEHNRLLNRLSSIFRKGRVSRGETQDEGIETTPVPGNSMQRQEAPLNMEIVNRPPAPAPAASLPEHALRVQPAQFQGAENTVLHNPRLTNVGGNYVVVNHNYSGGVEYDNSSKTSKDLTQATSGNLTYNDESSLNRNIRPYRTSFPTFRSSDIYYRHLAAEGRGYPLWIPEPNNRCPIEYRRKGISIGDVGIITPSGSFDFLFNICLPADHPINMDEVPPDFYPLDPPFSYKDVREQLEFRSDSYITSASVAKVSADDDRAESYGLTFETSASEGAILTIPNGAISEDLGNVTRLRQYTSQSLESWYKYFNGPRGREAQNGDIHVVVGVDRTNAWGMATFADMMADHHKFRLKFKSAGQSPTGSMYRWECSEYSQGRAQVRAGPDAREIIALRDEADDVPGGYENQCIFVRTLNPMLSDEVWKKTFSESGVVQDLDKPITNQNPALQLSNTQSSGSFSSSTANNASQTYGSQRFTLSSQAPNERAGSQVYMQDFAVAQTAHPSKALNEALLTLFPSSKMVITEDSNWIAAMKENKQGVKAKTLLPPTELVPLVLSMHSVCQEGDVTFLKLADASHPPILSGIQSNPVTDKTSSTKVAVMGELGGSLGPSQDQTTAQTTGNKGPGKARAAKLNADGTLSPPGADVNPLKSLDAPMKAEHALPFAWTIYHDAKSRGQSSSATAVAADGNMEFDDGVLVVVGDFDTMEGFCRYFNLLKPPSQLQEHNNYHVFKSGITPTWDDPANAAGGRWVLTMPKDTGKDLLDDRWSKLAIALVENGLDMGDLICGAVVSIRSNVYRIQLWTRRKDDVEEINDIGKRLAALLDASEGGHSSLNFQLNNLEQPPPGKYFSVQPMPSSELQSSTSSTTSLRHPGLSWISGRHFA